MGRGNFYPPSAADEVMYVPVHGDEAQGQDDYYDFIKNLQQIAEAHDCYVIDQWDDDADGLHWIARSDAITIGVADNQNTVAVVVHLHETDDDGQPIDADPIVRQIIAALQSRYALLRPTGPWTSAPY